MPATRSRTSTEAPEVAIEEKKSDVTEQTPAEESEAKETTEVNTETSAEQSTADEKPVEENTNGSTNDALPSDTNGDQSEDKVENGSAKRKSTSAEEGGDAPDSTDVTPKKAKLESEAGDDANGDKESGAADESDKPTPVETSA